MCSNILSIRTLLFVAVSTLPVFGQSKAQEASVSPALPPKVVARSSLLPPSDRFQLSGAPRINLGGIDESLRDAPAPARGVLRVATHRAVTQTTSAGAWQPMTDGTTVWRLQISSDNALGIRVHFRDFNAGLGQVWVHDTASPAKQSFGPYTGAGRNGNGDFWSETVFSNIVEVEYSPASGASTSGTPPFTVAEILHVWQLGPFAAPRPTSNTVSTAASLADFQIVPTVSTLAASPNYSCLVDATCYASNSVVSAAAPASALILFSDYQCSATILNAPNGEPEILTAGHCVNTEANAEGTEAFFGVQTSSCNASNADTYLTAAQLASFPEAVGLKLLSYSNLPFLDGTSSTQVQNDLDYSLIQLNNFPVTSGEVLAGYSATDVAAGGNATSLSYPDGLFLKVAFGTVQTGTTTDGSYFANAYEINQSTNGRVDSGSSGSGIFNDSGQLIGLLSTAESCSNPRPDGSCPTNFTSCSVASPFLAWYTKFSVVYQNINQYLTQPLTSTLPTNSSVFSATPNPVAVTDGSGLGVVTLNVNSTLTSFQVRVGAPNGPLFMQGSQTASATTGKWVSNGTVFYLQDISNGKSLTSSNTVDTVTVTFVASSFTANPASLPAGTYAAVTLTWDTTAYSSVDIHVNSPTGPLFAEGLGNGTVTTGPWSAAGTTFYLVDPQTGNTITSVTLGTSASASSASLSATPNPIAVPSGGSVYGQTTIYWSAPSSVSTVEVHIGSPSGPLFTQGGSSGSAQTGEWVSNNTVFYLQNTSGGLLLTAANTLATTTVTVVQQ